MRGCELCNKVIINTFANRHALISALDAARSEWGCTNSKILLLF